MCGLRAWCVVLMAFISLPCWVWSLVHHWVWATRWWSEHAANDHSHSVHVYVAFYFHSTIPLLPLYPPFPFLPFPPFIFVLTPSFFFIRPLRITANVPCHRYPPLPKTRSVLRYTVKQV
ncbi:hypothetical protein BDQ17DRAFT_759991 [Cyathus striatus]|nr:hypothetical protein BDQ17DRAFT_759991 [Cyathus striatus]